MHGLLFALSLLASGSVEEPHERGASGQPEVRIEVTRLADGDSWSASYTLAEPVMRLVFPDNTNLFRHAAWSVTTDGLELVVEDGHEVIRSAGGTTFEEVGLRFASNIGQLDRSYEFHVPFTDGGVLLYTGHLEVRSQAGALDTELVLSGRPDEHIWVAGAVHDTWVQRSEGEGFGTYAYFGTATPLETADVVALVDPGLPEWIRTESERYLPQLFELYAERLGFELPSRPMVFFSYISGRPGMADFSGGALEELIQLTVMGQQWATREGGSDEPFERLIGFLAHESVHLWNRPTGDQEPAPGSPWMHEGSADALSFRALLELGVIDRAGLFMRHSRALNGAAQRLQGTSVRESGNPQSSMNFYEAGSALAFATELALQDADPELDLFDFWRVLLAESRASGRSFTQDDYYALADRMAPGSDIGARLSAFVETRHEDPAAAFMDLFGPFSAIDIALDWDTGRVTIEPR
jgi:hypothetical protein